MIPLSDYLGFIFAEITRAREISDRTSAEIAKTYAQDPVMKFFSVPRFKIPEMALTIPVLISGAKFATVLKFKVELSKFSEFVRSELDRSVAALKLAKARTDAVSPVDIINVRPDIRPVRPVVIRPTGPLKRVANAPGLSDSPADAETPNEFATFYQLLTTSQHLEQPEDVIAIEYAGLFNELFKKEKLVEDYKKLYPKNELYLQSSKRIEAFVVSNTVVDSTKIENLLVNPETNIVRTESNQFSVFTINAKIIEDGVFVKSIQGQDGKVIRVEVDFE